MTTAAIILAAGSSSRLGQSKQMLRLQGETLIARTVRLAVEAGADAIFVVVGSDADAMREVLMGLPCRVILNDRWQDGMASSIRSGMQAVTAAMTPLPSGVLLMVCDQPLLDTSHLQKLLRVHAEGHHRMTASHYAGRLGVPAVFSQEMFTDLLPLKGDRGARDLIRTHAGAAEIVEFPGGELDLDTPSDLARFDTQGN